MTKIARQTFGLIMVVLLFNSFQMSAQTTAIPDPFFENKLIQLGIDSDGLVNGQILNSDAAAVTTLKFNQDTIHSLEGIHAFVNLDTLKCLNIKELLDDSLIISGYSSLKYIQFANNRDLKYLDFSNNAVLETVNCAFNNSLQYANFSNNAALETITCVSNSDLDSIDVSNDSLLSYLNCGKNDLSVLDVSSNVLLDWFFCSRNKLSSLNVLNNPNLTRLECRSNQLTSLDLSANVALTRLECWSNQLTSLDVSNNTSLGLFRCEGNQLTDLDVSANTALYHLLCGANQLTNLDLSNNTNLAFLGCNDNQLTNLDLHNNVILSVLGCNNNQLSRLVLPDTTLNIMNCQSNSDFLQICVPNATLNWTKTNWTKDILAVYVNDCFDQAVSGRVAIDFNMNCIADSLELGLKNQIIKFERDSTIVYFNTLDSLGSYRAYLDTGLYTVTVIPSSSYWQACSSSQQIYVDTNYNVQTINWSLQGVIDCPLLNVDIAAPFLRMTGGGSNYTVSYCNEGTVAATNSFVTVDLDPFLSYVSSSIPLTSQNGTLHTFNVGNIAVGACNSFTIQVLVDTSVALGQTHCTEAHIYPDSICVSNIWSGALINVEAACQNDSILFTIENVGNTMTQALDYYIVEDNIMMDQGNFNLGSATNTQIFQPAEIGKTYRILAEQENGYPSLLGERFATAAIEGCRVDSLGGFNTGFITQYNNNSSSPFIAIDCQQNIASYDPNDKSAQPKGYGAEHYIYDYTTLDYKVRFQNTGTDTAFTVVIRDTLSSYLDPTTLVMGASSHAYTWTLTGQGVLEVQFPNILLVDSMTNEPASNGFFQYKIQQKANNPIGTVINNTAAIYFDYNPPIFTNTTFHEVGDNFIPIVLTIGEIFEEMITVNVYPNPFTNLATIEVKGKGYDQLNLKVFDLTGRLVVEKQTYASNQIQLSDDNLIQGIYIYALEGNGELINTGKIIAQ